MPTHFTRPDKPLAEMSAEELATLKRSWYAQAKMAGNLERIHKVCRELGESQSVRYGPKYELSIGDVHIYLDGYGSGYMVVSTGGERGRRVCSTHPADELFVPGEWLDKVEAHYERALESESARKSNYQQAQRRELLEELGG